MATAKIEEYSGIVLSRIPQKEHDAMIRALGEKGFFTFYARGALKVGGATSFATQELTLGKYNLVVSSSGSLTLREGKMVDLFAPKSGLEALLSASMCLEYCLRCLPEEDAPRGYFVLRSALESLSEGHEPFSVSIMFLAQMLRLSGYGLEVDHCVVCGKTSDIVGFDFTQGGFLCADCLPNVGASPRSAEELKVYRHAFRCPLEDLKRVEYPENSRRPILIELLHFVHDALNIRLRSFEAILKY